MVKTNETILSMIADFNFSQALAEIEKLKSKFNSTLLKMEKDVAGMSQSVVTSFLNIKRSGEALNESTTFVEARKNLRLLKEDAVNAAFAISQSSEGIRERVGKSSTEVSAANQFLGDRAISSAPIKQMRIEYEKVVEVEKTLYDDEVKRSEVIRNANIAIDQQEASYKSLTTILNSAAQQEQKILNSIFAQREAAEAVKFRKKDLLVVAGEIFHIERQSYILNESIKLQVQELASKEKIIIKVYTEEIELRKKGIYLLIKHGAEQDKIVAATNKLISVEKRYAAEMQAVQNTAIKINETLAKASQKTTQTQQAQEYRALREQALIKEKETSGNINFLILLSLRNRINTHIKDNKLIARVEKIIQSKVDIIFS